MGIPGDLEWVCLVTGPLGGGGMVCPGQGMSWGGGYQPLLLTLSGGHHTYGRQAVGMHPTGMHSCFL